jgi:hypothetical protein
MSESTIRRLVRCAYEEEAAEAGLFADERIRSFFAVIKTLVHDCFYSLFDTVMKQYEPEERAARLARGLEYISQDQSGGVCMEESHRALREFPTIQQEYERAMVRFAQFMVPQKDPGMKIEVPVFSTFLMKLYTRVASSPDVRSGRFFSMSYFEKDIFLKDVMRVTMNSCIVLRPTAAPVQAASSTNSKAFSGSSSSSVAAGALAAAANASVATAAASESHVLPSDSVSNIGGASQRFPPPPPRAPAKLSVLTEALSSSSTHTGTDAGDGNSESQFSLRQHKERLKTSKARPFKTASVFPFKLVNTATKTVSMVEGGGSESAAGSPSDFIGYSTLSKV